MKGYFFIALGRYYIDECFLLSETIRKQGDELPISLLIKKEDEEYARRKNFFDKLIFFDPKDEIWTDCSNQFERYCLYPRINLDKFIPYDENIMVDSDVLCQYSASDVWSFCKSHFNPILMTGIKNDLGWHWGKISEVSEAYGKHVPHVHGGFFYLKKSCFLDTFFEYCREVFWRYDEYGCKRWFRGGRVDEIIFAIAHSKFNISPIDFNEFPIITFNYSKQIEIPSKLQTIFGVEMKNYIPFVHMFEKMNGENYKEIYNKIIEKK
jgi:lipopolysaccharide biosynthesis glycosyltransferase